MMTIATSSRRASSAVPWELEQVSDDVRADAAWFWRTFEGQPDLDHLTDAARRLLAVASVLFLRRGAVATSVRDITKAVGVSPGALYNHFESKELVLHTVVRHGNLRLLRRLDHDVRPDGRPARQLQEFITAWVIGHLEHQLLAQVVRREYIHLTGPRLAAVVRQRRTIRDRLARIVEAGTADGSFVPLGGVAGRSDPLPVAVMILDLCLAPTDWYDAGRGQDPADLAADYVTAAFRLLAAEQPAPGGP